MPGKESEVVRGCVAMRSSQMSLVFLGSCVFLCHIGTKKIQET